MGKKSGRYTVDEAEQLQLLKADGKSWGEIAEALGRDQHAVRVKWDALNKKNQTTRKPYTKKPVTGIATIQPQPHRPMIALVGTPAEVTATIRELFS